MNMNDFLVALDEGLVDKNTKKLLGEGKENSKVREEFRNALKEEGVNWEWLYEPDDRSMAVAELKGENKWAIYTFDSYKGESFDTAMLGNMLNEVDIGDDDDDEDVDLDGKTWEVSGKYTGNFLDIVKECIDVAKSDQFKEKGGVKTPPSNYVKV